jgi:SNF family Na+-dependent transporter
VTTFLMPLGALSMSLFVGWVMPLKKNDIIPLTNHKTKRWLRPALVFFLRWVVPVAIVLIFLRGMGLF